MHGAVHFSRQHSRSMRKLQMVRAVKFDATLMHCLYCSLQVQQHSWAQAADSMTHKTATAVHAVLLLLAVSCSSWADAARVLRQDDEIRILAIGDSITEGAVPSKSMNHPYTIQLEQYLRKLRPNTRVTIDNQGETLTATTATTACVHDCTAALALIIAVS